MPPNEESKRKRVEPQFPAVGLRCPDCGCGHWETIYTRPSPKGGIWRRRQCRHCGRRVTTVETPAEIHDAKAT